MSPLKLPRLRQLFRGHNLTRFANKQQIKVPVSPFAMAPPPLIFRDHNIVLSFAPKSACSHVALWFYRHEGLMEAASYFDDWPHHFRTDVYYRSTTYLRRRRAVVEAQAKGYTLIRVTRDPTKRFVSCFRHACRFPTIYESLRRKLGHDPATQGLSLNDYYTLLFGENLQAPSSIDIHLRAQTHPVWMQHFDRVITLNIDETHMNPGLNAIEDALGLEQTQFKDYPQFDSLRATHYAIDRPYDGVEAIENLRFSRESTKHFPKQQLEVLPLSHKMAQELHGVDFGQVHSGDTDNVLFQSGCALAR